MRPIALLLACCFAFLLPGLSAAAARTPPRPLLWKLSNGGHTVYLLGSFHLLRAADYPLAPAVDAAFDDAETVVFEVPPAELADPRNGALAAGLARYADGRSMTRTLPEPLRARLQVLLAGQGGSLAQYDAFEPWFVNLGLVMGISEALGFRADLGLDQALIRRATDAGKRTAGLESLESQLRALDATPEAEQIASLAEFADDPAELRRSLEELHATWRAGDPARLDALTGVRMAKETPQTYRLLNIQRNRAWLPKIEAMLRAPGRDDTLVVVGAMHLLGRDGLVEQLRARGYRVERLAAGLATEPVRPAERSAAPRFSPGASGR